MRGGTCWVPLIKMKAVKARTSVSASRGLQGLTKRMRVMRRVVSAGCQPVGVNGRVCGVSICVERPEPVPRYAVGVMGEEIVPIPGGKP